MPVSSVGKRDSLLRQAAELKDRSSTKTSKPVSVSLDSNSDHMEQVVLVSTKHLNEQHISYLDHLTCVFS